MSERVDFSTIRRPRSPNTYLVLPDGFTSTAEADMPSPSFALAPAALLSSVRAFADEKDWQIVVQDEATQHLEAIASTAVLKFKDDIAIGVFEDPSAPGHSKLAVYSRSRVGYHDLGANRKRVEWLLAELKQSR